MKHCIGAVLLLLCIGTLHAQISPQQHELLVKTARQIAARKIDYNERWRPPGRKDTWVMDCSNTSRYLYGVVFNKNIPRTASDQYYELLQRKRITLAPRKANGDVDTAALIKKLRAGDLLFWEWTYNIKRRPPITHVMVYLGTNKDGVPKMFGYSSGRNGGVKIYEFDPNAPSGAARGMFGRILHRGKFVGFGRYFLNSSTTAEKQDQPNQNSQTALSTKSS